MNAEDSYIKLNRISLRIMCEKIKLAMKEERQAEREEFIEKLLNWRTEKGTWWWLCNCKWKWIKAIRNAEEDKIRENLDGVANALDYGGWSGLPWTNFYCGQRDLESLYKQTLANSDDEEIFLSTSHNEIIYDLREHFKKKGFIKEDE